MKIRTKFVTVYRTPDEMIEARVRFSTDVEIRCPFIHLLKNPLPVHHINFPCYFSKGVTNYDFFTPCPYA